MIRLLFVILSFALLAVCSSCNSCGRQDTNYLSGDYGYYEEDYTDYLIESVGGNAMKTPVEMEVPQGQSLQEAGREVYADLLDLERLGLGGIKLCAEMSADQQGRWSSSFYQPTNITFQSPPDLHLHKIVVTENSSNIICRIINGEIGVTVGNVQNNSYRTSAEQPAFIINITASNRTEDTVSCVIPLGQMLEVQAPNVQNIVVSNTYSDILKPYQSKIFSVRAYCGAEKRQNPTYKPAKLTPFVLTAPTYAYNSQSSLWDFQRTKPVNDKYYTLTFYAWRVGSTNSRGEKSLTGHAFVDIPEIGVVGYGGTVTDHSNQVQYADYKVSVKINETALRKAQAKYWEWKNNPPAYDLAKYDCTTFAMDIADAAGIYYGPRWTIQFPAGFLRNLTAVTYLNKVSSQFLNELRTYNE
jgi:hypothetical protein